MQSVGAALPILPRKTAAARADTPERDANHNLTVDLSQRRVHILREIWSLAAALGGNEFVGYTEGDDFGRALELSAQTRGEFDRWRKFEGAPPAHRVR